MSEPACIDHETEPPDLDGPMLRVMMAAAAYQARRIARTLRLSADDRQDAEQQVLLALLERRRFFDVARGTMDALRAPGGPPGGPRHRRRLRR